VDHNIQVLEVSGSNVTSVAEHAVMSMLLLVRNFVPAHEVRGSFKICPVVLTYLGCIQMIQRGEWQVSNIARQAYDLEGKVVGTIGAGRIGRLILERLVPFNTKEHLYYDYTALPASTEKELNARRVENLEVRRSSKLSSLGTHRRAAQDFVSQCDVVTVNAPLHEGTKGLINDQLLSKFKPGAWIVNTARGAICDKDAIARALASGQISGYAGGQSTFFYEYIISFSHHASKGDVWNVQPAPKDHVWRTMKNPLGGGNGMVPHYSGTTLDAQARYAAGTRTILENYLDGKPQESQNVIVGVGE
jgi:formate dehydrogenase